MIDKTLYIGPYAQCVIPQKFEPDTQSHCANPKCEWFGVVALSDYCSGRGCKIEEVEIGKRLIRPENNEGELEDIFQEYSGESSPTVNLVPNNDDFVERTVFFDIEDLNTYTLLAEVDRPLINRERGAFTLKYDKYLKLLIPLYETISIKWGILCNVS